MGNWNITVRGVGVHHNGKSLPEDANRMAAEFVQKLKEKGHHVTAASFTSGSEDDITDPAKYLEYYKPDPPTEADDSPNNAKAG